MSSPDVDKTLTGKLNGGTNERVTSNLNFMKHKYLAICVCAWMFVFPAVAHGSNVTGGYFTATSSADISAFAGGFSIQTDKLIVQQTGGNVGIGTMSPSAHLEISASGETAS